MAKKKHSFITQIRLLKKAGVESIGQRHLMPFQDNLDCSISERIELIKSFLKKASNRKTGEMYCFIMYDISDNKIRNYIAKYLLKAGCQRIQKSVYMAGLKKAEFNEIYTTLKEVNDMYDNEDSIFFVPIGESQLNELKLVGKNIDYSLVTNSINTLFI